MNYTLYDIGFILLLIVGVFYTSFKLTIKLEGMSNEDIKAMLFTFGLRCLVFSITVNVVMLIVHITSS